MTKKRPPPHNGKIKNTRITLIFLQKKGETTMKNTNKQFTNGTDYSLIKPYTSERTQQLAEKTKDELTAMVADLEFTLLMYLDGVFDENLKDINSETAYQHLNNVDKKAIKLLLSLEEKEYKEEYFKGLHEYSAITE